MRFAGEAGITLLPVGGGSNTVGSTEPESGETVAVRLSRFGDVEWDETALTVTAGAGVVLADLETTLNRHGYTLGSLPQSAQIATVGGAVATDAHGVFAAGYGAMRSNTLALQAVLYNGDAVQTCASGATTRALHHLLIGTEGAFGIITSATLAMRPQPEVRAWCAFSFARFEDAADALRLLYRSDARPACVRLFDADAARSPFAGLVPPGHALLLLGVEGSEVVQTGHYQTVFAVCRQTGGTESAVDGDAWFESERFRTDAFAANGRSGALAAVWASWTAVPAFYRAVTDAVRPDASEVSAQIGYATPQGAALDVRFVLETASPGDAIARYERVSESATATTVAHGAQVAHHWGVGITHREQAPATNVLKRLASGLREGATV